MGRSAARGQAAGRLRSQWTRVGPLVLHCKVGVDSPPAGRLPLVCVHGLLVSGRYMLAAAVRLAPAHPVYALDLPGYGRSSKPPAAWPGYTLAGLSRILRDWLDAQRRARVGLLANSFGCQIATAFARRYPGRAACLVLVGPTVDARRRSLGPQATRLALDAPREPLRRYVRLLAPDLAEIGVPRTLRLAGVALRDRIEERLPAVGVPTLAIRGGHDPLAPQDWADAVVALLPQGHLVTIPGSGHVVHFAAPDAVVDAVRPFLERSGAGDHSAGWDVGSQR